MNQILNYIAKNDVDDVPEIKKSKKRFFIVIIIAIVLIVIAISFYIFSKYRLYKNEQISKNLVSNYNIMTLYSNNSDKYTVFQNSNDNIAKDEISPFIIGLIQIDKINLIYPILSTTNSELLKISPCRFAGPMPNEIGNLCIAGHNYVDNKLFSKLFLLEIGDEIEIYSLSGSKISYTIYYKNEIKYDDLSCMNQNTNNRRIITLITCNNVNGNRLCIKADENK